MNTPRKIPSGYLYYDYVKKADPLRAANVINYHI
jgi:hypothetical protein